MPSLLSQVNAVSPEAGFWIWTAIVVFFGLVAFGLWAWSIFWAYHDAERRGKSGVLVALVVAFLPWPMGLLAWLIFRPEAGTQRSGLRR